MLSCNRIWVGEIERKIGVLRQDVLFVGRIAKELVHRVVYILDESKNIPIGGYVRERTQSKAVRGI